MFQWERRGLEEEEEEEEEEEVFRTNCEMYQKRHQI
jgi:hypothetical protein